MTIDFTALMDSTALFKDFTVLTDSIALLEDSAPLSEDYNTSMVLLGD